MSLAAHQLLSSGGASPPQQQEAGSDACTSVGTSSPHILTHSSPWGLFEEGKEKGDCRSCPSCTCLLSCAVMASNASVRLGNTHWHHIWCSHGVFSLPSVAGVQLWSSTAGSAAAEEEGECWGCSLFPFLSPVMKAKTLEGHQAAQLDSHLFFICIQPPPSTGPKARWRHRRLKLLCKVVTSILELGSNLVYS